MAKLTQTVVLRETPSSLPRAFGPEDELPTWAAKQLEGKDHLFEPYDPRSAYYRGGSLDKARVPRPADQKRGRDYESGQAVTPPVGSPILEDLDPAKGEDQDDDGDSADEAPKRNASKATWLAFAQEAIADGFPVQLADGMDREDIIKACEDAEVIEPKPAAESK